MSVISPRSRVFAGAAFAFLLCSCLHAADPPPALPTATLVVDTIRGPAAFRVEIAADEASQERGLMYRTHLAPNAGMLFDFHHSQPVSFWMKNTVLPLDMVFIREDGTISSIEPNARPYSEDGIPSIEPVRAVLEINGGRAHDLGLAPGEKVHGAIFGTDKAR